LREGAICYYCGKPFQNREKTAVYERVRLVRLRESGECQGRGHPRIHRKCAERIAEETRRADIQIRIREEARRAAEAGEIWAQRIRLR
jgi:hypothetical protein